VWVISYGYTADAARAREIARQAARAGHAYGSDEDAVGAGAIDPTVNIYDLGADPMAWGRQRAALIKATIPELPRRDALGRVPLGHEDGVAALVGRVGKGVRLHEVVAPGQLALGWAELGAQVAARILDAVLHPHRGVAALGRQLDVEAALAQALLAHADEAVVEEAPAELIGEERVEGPRQLVVGDARHDALPPSSFEAIFEDDLKDSKEMAFEPWKNRPVLHKLKDFGAFVFNEQL
jgi:hypothetical protein